LSLFVVGFSTDGVALFVAEDNESLFVGLDNDSTMTRGLPARGE
jgi:hypothetical protein